MRFALLTPLIAAGALFACSTFSGSEDDEPPPSTDGGTETGPDGGACTPVVFDPSAPSACPGKDLSTDPKNCGACGHECVDKACAVGHCESEQLTSGPQPIIAIIGTVAYVPSGSTIERADLTQRPLPVTFSFYFDNVSGKVNHLEAHGGEIYIGWDNDQTILERTEPEPTPRPNAGFAAVKTTAFGGHYLPGATSYYLFPDPSAGVNLARIGPDLAVDYQEKQNDFLPIARSGDAIYWTQKLAGGANIYGPWERDDDPIARVDASLEAFGAEGDTVFVVGNNSLSRATRGAPVVPLATEPGVGVAFAIDGDQLFYAVRRTDAAQERHRLFRIDKCKGGEPVPLLDVNVPILGIYFNEPTHVLVNTTSGLFRIRR